MSDLEETFRQVLEANREELKQHLRDATVALEKAVELSESTGIPFESSISQVSQSYCPTSYPEKFGGLDKNAVCDLTWVWDLDGYGWQHSQAGC